MSRGVRGQGTKIWFDWTLGGTYVEDACMFTEVKPAGFNRDTAPQEPCLSEAAALDDLGDLNYTPITGTVFFDQDDTVVHDNLSLRVQDKATFAVTIEMPFATKKFQECSAVKCQQYEPQMIDRTSKIKADVTFIVRAAPTESATPPTTS